MFPVTQNQLAGDHQTHIVRAHRLRSAVVAGIFRHLTRWVSAASR